MVILSVLLYAVAIILTIILVLLILVLFVPISYRFSGHYESFLRIKYGISFSPLLKFRGHWSSNNGGPNQMQVVFAGFSFTVDPEKMDTKKDKPKKKKKETTRLPLSFYINNFEKAIIKNGLETVKDVLIILLPRRIELNGRIGFDEPHLTGWFAALKSIIQEYPGQSWCDLQPVWDEEYYNINLLVEGRIIVFLLLYRVARFMLSRRTIKYFWNKKKKKKYYAA